MANGIVGLKPTYGRVSRHGVLPLAETLDHVGPMTRSVEDSAVFFETIAGHDPRDPTSLQEAVPDMRAELRDGVKGLTIAYDRDYASGGTDPGLVEAMEKALDDFLQLGATVHSVSMPDSSEIGGTWFTICSREAFLAHEANFTANPDQFGHYFRDFLTMGSTISEDDYARAMTSRRRYSEQFEAVLAEVDALLCPSGGAPFPAQPDLLYGGEEALQFLVDQIQMQFTIPADFAGTPGLTVPCGMSASGIPYTLQLLGSRAQRASLVPDWLRL